jgi:hypothetical protein
MIIVFNYIKSTGTGHAMTMMLINPNIDSYHWQ